MHPKRFLLGILALSLIAAGAYTAYNRGLLNDNSLLAKLPFKRNEITKQVDAEVLQNIANSAESQSGELFTRAGVVLGETKEAINEVVKPSNNEKAIHEKAFEQARYIYCQEVVKEYEENSTTK